jgi:hypothetical protein
MEKCFMKKRLLSLFLILLLSTFIGCGAAPADSEPLPDPEDPTSSHKVEAPEAVVSWAQYEIDALVRMLAIELLDSEIINLQLAKQLDFYDSGTIDLYEIDFKLHPGNLKNDSNFNLDPEGWIPSDNNFIYSDATGVEQSEGQLYLLISNHDGELSSMGIRRAESLSDQWCKDLLVYYNYPPGVNFSATEEQIRAIRQYWEWQSEWSFTMPSDKGYGDTWSVGLGYAHEWGLGIPYEFISYESERSQDLVSLTFANVIRRYYDGLTVTSLSGFYGDNEDEPGFDVNQYISVTQPDCMTSRGIRVGDTVDALKAAYPEATAHDGVWVYAPEGTNRSLLFIIRDGAIVQIDMGDGLDGQYMNPAGVEVM